VVLDRGTGGVLFETVSAPTFSQPARPWRGDPAGYAHRGVMMEAMDGQVDYRFSLANERTYLSWLRTALALVAGGLAAAKALHFDHEVYRWVVAAPPIAAGAFLALQASVRWRRYETAMTAGEPLPAGRGLKAASVALSVYAAVALLATVLDG